MSFFGLRIPGFGFRVLVFAFRVPGIGFGFQTVGANSEPVLSLISTREPSQRGDATASLKKGQFRQGFLDHSPKVADPWYTF